MKLTKEYIKKYIGLKKQIQIMDEKIYKRLGEILLAIYEAFEIKTLENYWFNSGQDEGIGHLNYDALTSKYVDKNVKISYCVEDEVDYLFTEKWNYSDCFPKIFLYMSSKDIIMYIKKEIQKSPHHRDCISFRRSGLTKLSYDEQKALGLI